MELLQNSVSWDNVPELIIINIFSYLNLRDRYNAGLVNSKWSRMFRLPVLWRRVNFVFYGSPHNLNGALDFIPTIINRRSEAFADRMGKYVRTMIMRFVSQDRTHTRRIQKEVEVFLRRMTQRECELEELRIDCCVNSSYWSVPLRKKLIDSFIHFLDSQHHLQKVFLKLNIKSEEVRVLETLIDINGDNINQLECIFFYSRDPGMYVQSIFHKLMRKMPDLHSLVLPVESVDDAVVKSISENCQLLKCMEIAAINPKYSTVDTSPGLWLDFCQVNPHITVKFKGFLPRKLSNFPQVIPSGMPLVSLILILNEVVLEPDWDMSRCISYIEDRFSSTLESFALVNGSPGVPIPLNESLLSMITKCYKLKELTLHFPMDFSLIKDICAVLNRREDMVKLRLATKFFNKADIKCISELQKKYKKVLC